MGAFRLPQNWRECLDRSETVLQHRTCYVVSQHVVLLLILGD